MAAIGITLVMRGNRGQCGRERRQDLVILSFNVPSTLPTVTSPGHIWCLHPGLFSPGLLLSPAMTLGIDSLLSRAHDLLQEDQSVACSSQSVLLPEQLLARRSFINAEWARACVRPVPCGTFALFLPPGKLFYLIPHPARSLSGAPSSGSLPALSPSTAPSKRGSVLPQPSHPAHLRSAGLLPHQPGASRGQRFQLSVRPSVCLIRPVSPRTKPVPRGYSARAMRTLSWVGTLCGPIAQGPSCHPSPSRWS